MPEFPSSMVLLLILVLLLLEQEELGRFEEVKKALSQSFDM